MKKSMTTEDLFNKVCSILKEKGRMPDILNYGLPTNSPAPIRTYEFDLKGNFAYGGCEGIYLDLWIEYFMDRERHTSDCGTFKTLRHDDEAMHIMAGLLADFIIEESVYVNANLDDFTWEDADVHPYDESGKRLSWGHSCSSMEVAIKRKDELLKKYPQVVVRDNVTREEKVFQRQIEKEIC